MNAYQLYRETKENLNSQYYPRAMTDPVNDPFLTRIESVSTGVVDYHYDRRHEIKAGIIDFTEDKARSKAAIAGAKSYARRKPAHLAAKILTRGIPYVGWALLAYDAVQLYRWYQD